jgi:hypothetical protein
MRDDELSCRLGADAAQQGVVLARSFRIRSMPRHRWMLRDNDSMAGPAAVAAAIVDEMIS